MKEKDIDIFIPQPCPFYYSNRNKVEGGYNCKSCNKCVVDFRGKSKSEILETIANSQTSVCGIFDREVIATSGNYSWRRQFLLSILTLASFLGFSVKPLSAQTADTSFKRSDTTQNHIARNSDGKVTIVKQEKEVKKENNLKQKRKYRRRILYRRRTLLGCPNF